MAIAQIDPIEFWMVREVAHQDSVHIHVEAGTCRPGAQYGQFILGTGRAQVGPVIDDVKVGARSTLEFTAARIAMNVHGSWANHALALGLPKDTGAKAQVDEFIARRKGKTARTSKAQPAGEPAATDAPPF